jgi:hypothetical protein
MSREERLSIRASEVDGMIDRFSMESVTGMSRDKIRRLVLRGMVSNNLAFVLADVAHSFLMDCEGDLSRLGVCFGHADKYNFNQMLFHLRAAMKWAKKSALPMYGICDSADACASSDWWYAFVKLVDDRVGSDYGKTKSLLDLLLGMSREEGLYDVTFDDFKVFEP